RLTILGNSVSALAAAVGDSTTGLALLVALIQALVDALRDMISTPAGSFLAAIAVAFAAIGGTLLVVTSGVIRYMASMAALSTAKKELQITNLGLIGTFKALNTAVTGNTAAMAGNAAATKGASGALMGLGKAGGYAL